MRTAGDAEMVPPVLSLTIDPGLVVEKGYENKVQNFCEGSLYGLGWYSGRPSLPRRTFGDAIFVSSSSRPQNCGGRQFIC